MQVADKLAKLRKEMASEKVDALIVGNSDPHNNEYAAPRWESRQWLSHMKGSSGVVVVTAEWCGLWADARYYEAAEAALEGTEIELMRMSDVGCPSIETWLKTNLEEGQTVSFDGAVTDLNQTESRLNSLQPAGIKVNTDLDLVGRVWEGRPEAPKGELFLVDEELAGKSVVAKISEVRAKLKELKVDAHLLGRPDEACWLFNFRGTDIADATTPYCFTLVTQDEVHFFIDQDKISDEGRKRFDEAGVTLRDYDEIEAALRALDSATRILIVPRYTNYQLAKAISHCVQVKERAVVTDLKGVKNATEVAHIKEAMLDDGAALVKFFHWMYSSLDRGDYVSELSASHKLTECRATFDGFQGRSFRSIMGYAEHGALNHYSVDESSDQEVKKENIFLIDSGGRFEKGTTDTTRVIPMGEPTQEQKEDYTAVLRALIEMITVKFAEGATGAQLDGICRQPLWLTGRNFKHGTGHGIGFGLEVHEGPQSISGRSLEKFVLGQITTIEPGCYRSGKHGVRIENMVHTVLSEETDFGRFFEFENLTFCPINVDLVEPDMLTPAQIDWLNSYNAEVVEKLASRLSDDELTWLKHECRSISHD